MRFSPALTPLIYGTVIYGTVIYGTVIYGTVTHGMVTYGMNDAVRTSDTVTSCALSLRAANRPTTRSRRAGQPATTRHCGTRMTSSAR
jgi:hypothetical protein